MYDVKKLPAKLLESEQSRLFYEFLGNKSLYLM